ncbi:DUF808 domain-containing protein, partial [Rathayibacter sp. AY1G1]
GAGPVVVWLADTFVSMIFGLVLGLVIAAVVMGVSRLRTRDEAAAGH